MYQGNLVTYVKYEYDVSDIIHTFLNQNSYQGENLTNGALVTNPGSLVQIHLPHYKPGIRQLLGRNGIGEWKSYQLDLFTINIHFHLCGDFVCVVIYV